MDIEGIVGNFGVVAGDAAVNVERLIFTNKQLQYKIS